MGTPEHSEEETTSEQTVTPKQENPVPEQTTETPKE